MIDKAKGLGADQVFLDIEDAVAPLAKPEARKNIVSALNEGGWGDTIRTVRVNDWTTQWTYSDVVEVVEGAGANLDAIMLPKVQTPEQVVALDMLLTQIEKSTGLEVGRIGIEAQIENALGLTNVNAIAAASQRVETIIFGPADFMASINMKSLVVGEQPPGYDVGDAYHHILMSILMAARAYDKQAIDGPYLQIKDIEGFRRVAGRSAALGFDGKWVLHPGELVPANEVYSPRQSDYDHAREHPGRLRLLHVRGWWQERCGHARRREDRRGLAQDGHGDLGQGPGCSHDPPEEVGEAWGLTRDVHGVLLRRTHRFELFEEPIRWFQGNKRRVNCLRSQFIWAPA